MTEYFTERAEVPKYLGTCHARDFLFNMEATYLPSLEIHYMYAIVPVLSAVNNSLSGINFRRY